MEQAGTSNPLYSPEKLQDNNSLNQTQKNQAGVEEQQRQKMDQDEQQQQESSRGQDLSSRPIAIDDNSSYTDSIRQDHSVTQEKFAESPRTQTSIDMQQTPYSQLENLKKENEKLKVNNRAIVLENQTLKLEIQSFQDKLQYKENRIDSLKDLLEKKNQTVEKLSEDFQGNLRQGTEMNFLQDKLQNLRQEQLETEKEREKAWFDLRRVVDDLSKLTRPDRLRELQDKARISLDQSVKA